MTPERWRAVQDIFEQALDRPEGERGGWLDNACAGDHEVRGEVDSLLASERAAKPGFLGAYVQQAVIQLEEAERRVVEGRRVGSYRLLRELGRGGMGVVYLAERADEQGEPHVAIKLVRRGLDTDFILRRFRRERQILAHLQHPNIARLLDGGTTDGGVPYIVMEYIDGAWITAYAAERNLSVEQKLRLFLPVCDALSYAHRNFIVHRDLKPGNILVGRDGAPKLLDFGVSKLLHTETASPDYASPEQIIGDPITLVSDVYSLGAVLFELLTGCRPHRIDSCTPFAIERAIYLDDTQAPSKAVRMDRSLAQRLTGDLDSIILRSMQKQPEHRYASVEEFAEDIRRHLDHRPVRARPDSTGYRLRKFVRRNRVAVSLSALIAGSLIAGAAVTFYEGRRAQQRLEQTRQLAAAFVSDVDAAARNLPGSMPLRQFIARTGLEYLNNLARTSSGDPMLQRDLAATYQRIGDLQRESANGKPGDSQGALASYRNAETLLRQVLEHRRLDLGATLDFLHIIERIGNLQMDSEQPGDALSTLREGLARGRAIENPEVAKEVAHLLIDIARVEGQSGHLQAALDDANQGIDRMERFAGAQTQDKETRLELARAYAEKGAVLSNLSRPQEALENSQRGVALLEKLRDSYPADVGVRRQLMLAYSGMGDDGKMTEEAKAIYDANPGDLRAAGDYGIALIRMAAMIPDDKRDEKREMLEDVQMLLSRADAVTPDSDGVPTLVLALHNLGEEYAGSGERAAALSVKEELVKVGDAVNHKIAAPEAYRAAGAVYSSLAAEDSDATRRNADRAAAIEWHERAMVEWRALELQKDFSPVNKRQLAECERELAELRTPTQAAQ